MFDPLTPPLQYLNIGYEQNSTPAEVFRMRIPELCGTAEAAEILGVSRNTISTLRKNPRSGAPFPEPVAELQCGPIWLKEDIVKYQEAIKRISKEKYDNCAATDERLLDGISLDAGWDMKVIWRIRKMLDPKRRMELLEKNGWVEYYKGLTREDPAQPNGRRRPQH
jgi:hypothetical protein